MYVCTCVHVYVCKSVGIAEIQEASEVKCMSKREIIKQVVNKRREAVKRRKESSEAVLGQVQ